MARTAPKPWTYNGRMKAAPRSYTVKAGSWTFYAPTEATARLIAAAPDLLEALRDIASSGCCETLGCSEDNPSCDAMIARAAIAAATAT